MSGLLKKSALALACGLAFSATAQAADTTISFGGVTATINDQGTFASYQDGALTSPPAGPAMGSPGLRYNGVEFVNIDVPSSWWWLSASSTNYVSHFGVVNAPLPAPTTTTGGGLSATTTNLTLPFPSLVLQQTWSITGPGKISVAVQISNNGTAALNDVAWGVGLDPDQGGSTRNTTQNTILGNGNASSVIALDVDYGTNASINLVNTTTSSAFTIRPYINLDCCSPTSPGTIFTNPEQVAGFFTHGDDSIALAYSIGTIGAGATVTLGYDYILSAPIPEPETYAMLLAGLGLMGFMARRRKRT